MIICETHMVHELFSQGNPKFDQPQIFIQIKFIRNKIKVPQFNNVSISFNLFHANFYSCDHSHKNQLNYTLLIYILLDHKIQKKTSFLNLLFPKLTKDIFCNTI